MTSGDLSTKARLTTDLSLRWSPMKGTLTIANGSIRFSWKMVGGLEVLQVPLRHLQLARIEYPKVRVWSYLKFIVPMLVLAAGFGLLRGLGSGDVNLGGNVGFVLGFLLLIGTFLTVQITLVTNRTKWIRIEVEPGARWTSPPGIRAPAGSERAVESSEARTFWVRVGRRTEELLAILRSNRPDSPGAMAGDQTRFVMLRSIRRDDLTSDLGAVITDEGELMLAGDDYGTFVESWFDGAKEYEYWLTVDAIHVEPMATAIAESFPWTVDSLRLEGMLPTLRSLFSDGTFDSEGDLKKWLEVRGIPFRFDTWISVPWD